MLIPSKEEMLTRYWALRKTVDAVAERIAPLREARDAYVNEAAAHDETLMAEIRAIEAEVEPGLNMADAQFELGFLARGLGNVGDDPAAT